MAEASHRNHSTPVADDWNWTSRIRSELGASKAWQRNWGFLVDGQHQPQQPPPGASDKPAAPAPSNAATTDALATFMQQAGQSSPTSNSSLSYIAAKQRDSARARRLVQQDSLDGFVKNYMVRGDPRVRQLPAQEFRKPLTTSHEYGWGRSLEVFGNMPLVMK